jgi:hypothetical protein
VNGSAECASCSTLANHKKPVPTMIGPTRFSGRARQDSRPLPINNQPTNSTSVALGTCGRSGPASPVIQAAPVPASSPATPSPISFAFIPG